MDVPMHVRCRHVEIVLYKSEKHVMMELMVMIQMGVLIAVLLRIVVMILFKYKMVSE